MTQLDPEELNATGQMSRSSEIPPRRGMLHDRLLTIAEVEEVLRTSRDTVERLVKSGELAAVDVSPNADSPAHRPTWRVRRGDLDTFLQRRRSVPVSPERGKRRMKRTGLIEFIH